MILKWKRGNDLGINIKNYKLPVGGELEIEIMVALEYFKSSKSQQM